MLTNAHETIVNNTYKKNFDIIFKKNIKNY